MLPNCPYCKQALRWQQELQQQYPELAKLTIRNVDEAAEPVFAGGYGYYFVPCYCVGGVKMHEGAATKEKIEAVLRSAL